MSSLAKPPYRADHVGSLLRPDSVKKARKRYFEDKAISAEELKEVEDAAIATGAVAEAVAVGVPDPRLGQAVCLAVRPQATFDEAAFRKALAAALPNFMQPRTIRTYDAMPRNPNGKLDRAVLKAELAS